VVVVATSHSPVTRLTPTAHAAGHKIA
jgi:hypothetical protein